MSPLPPDAPLLLTEELAEALLGALLAVCRADGDTTRAELRVLHAVGRVLVGDPARVIERQLFFSTVTPRSLGETLASISAAGPFRGSAISPLPMIARAFVRAALEVARADGSLDEAEVRTINSFGRALGASNEELLRLDPSLDEVRLEAWG